jgi:hypothetical protein
MQVVLRFANGDVEHRQVLAPSNPLLLERDGDLLAFRHVRTTLGLAVYEQEPATTAGD